MGEYPLIKGIVAKVNSRNLITKAIFNDDLYVFVRNLL